MKNMPHLQTKKQLIFLVVLAVLTSACTPTESQEKAKTSGQVYQYGTIQALLEGHYDSDLSLGDLKKHGDLGIGTFNALDGEMVILNDTVFQIKSDWLVYLPTDAEQTPYATSVAFQADTSLSLNGPVDYIQFQKLIDGLLPSRNLFYAFKIEGVFNELKVRSVPRQTPPYVPLGEAVNGQTMFGYESIAGTLVGFHFPEYTDQISVPGYHLHFISADRQRGGHVLFFEGITAEMHLDIISGMNLELPTNEAFKKLDLTKNREEELEKVEKLTN